MREDRLLKPDRESKQTLRELLGVARLNPKHVMEVKRDARVQTALIAPWLKQLPKKRLRMIALAGVDLRDELGPALEELRSRETEVR